MPPSATPHREISVLLPDYIPSVSEGPFRVVIRTDEGVIRIEQAIELNGHFALQPGASPIGTTEDELRVSFAAYERALTLPWFAVRTSLTTPLVTPVAAPADLIERTRPAQPQDYGFDYRVGVDDDGEMTVYQCFFALGDAANGYENVQDACACGYTEQDFIADTKLYLAAFSKSRISVRWKSDDGPALLRTRVGR
jgi:hypothetical protein